MTMEVSGLQLAGAFHDRICPPGETVARMRPHLEQLGITRIARQTGLDRLGIPVFASIRPNAALLSVNQGKGIDDDSARASAIMEAAEFAIAERLELPTILASADYLRSIGCDAEPCLRLMPMGYEWDGGRPIHWVAGQTRWQTTVYVPLDALRLDGDAKELPGICHTTNGLASGNSYDEALFHGLCELIERDAYSRWALRSPADRAASCFPAEALRDAEMIAMVKHIEEQGCLVRLFDQTTDIDVPVICAVIFDPTPRAGYFDIAAGYGAHPLPHRASLRALTEAAQTRITSIASSRDDIVPWTFDLGLGANALDLTAAAPLHRPGWTLPTHGAALSNLIDHLYRQLLGAGIPDSVVVDLSPRNLPFHVVRVLNPVLEDLEANTNWRPGPRALGWMLA